MFQCVRQEESNDDPISIPSRKLISRVREPGLSRTFRGIFKLNYIKIIVFALPYELVVSTSYLK